MKAKGFTLIEVLIALMLLSMVMYIGNLSFSVFSERWRKELGTFNSEVQAARQLLLLRQVISGAANFMVRDNEDRASYLFHGDQQQLVFVTNSPLFHAGQQAWVKLSVTDTQNGKQQLRYAEYSFVQGPVTSFTEPAELTHSLVLMEQENIRLNYFGWSNFAARIRYLESTTGQPAWQQDYNAASIGVLPFALNISWGQNEPLVFLLPHDNRTNFSNVYDERNEA